MNFNFINKLPTPLEIKQRFPLNTELKEIKEKRDKEIKDILSGKSNKFIVIIGPCSAHDRDAVLEYTERLSKIQSLIKEKVILIPRIYTNKPRTNGCGYKGLLHQPDPNKEPDMLSGITEIRKLHIDVLKYNKFSTADEMLYPENHRYINDILSYTSVGARSVENQFHRLTASGIGIACGMKNPLSGNLNTMVNSILAAQNKHTFIYRGWEVATPGNKYAHAILRGYVNFQGESFPNYHYEDIIRLYKLYLKYNLQNPSLIIDVNHSNSAKNYLQQIRITKEVLYNRTVDKSINKFIKGVMIESYIKEGVQEVGGKNFGQSITDPCLGWNDTENLLLYIAKNC